jgi:hypothetical protein
MIEKLFHVVKDRWRQIETCEETHRAYSSQMAR